MDPCMQNFPTVGEICAYGSLKPQTLGCVPILPVLHQLKCCLRFLVFEQRSSSYGTSTMPLQQFPNLGHQLLWINVKNGL